MIDEIENLRLFGADADLARGEQIAADRNRVQSEARAPQHDREGEYDGESASRTARTRRAHSRSVGPLPSAMLRKLSGV